jgi:hypothetical protein
MNWSRRSEAFAPAASMLSSSVRRNGIRDSAMASFLAMSRVIS